MIIYLFIAGCVLYGLSFLHPKTDKIIYAFAGFMFLFGAIAGYQGITINTGETINFEYSNNITTTKIITPVYDNSIYSTLAIPTTMLLLAIYMFSAIIMTDDTRKTKSDARSRN